MPIAPARRVALDLFRSIEAGACDLGAALAEGRHRLGDERDRALASDILIGSFRWRAVVDHVVGQHSRLPIERLDPVVRAILRLSVFQLLYLDRVPAAAVVDDAVQLTRARGVSSAAPFVNGVLRAVARAGRRPDLPARPSVPASSARAAWVTHLSVVWSHPSWLVARWLDRWGLETTEAWLAFNSAPAPLTLRANRLVVTREELAARLGEAGVETHPTPYAPDGLVVDRGNPLRTPHSRAGLFVVQDEASQLVAELVRACPGERLLDACAAPGGKTLALAAAARGGLVVACDARPPRVALLARVLRQHHAATVRTVRADFTSPAPFAAVFDAVLIDAPCSGLGTLRRDPDVKWRRREADLLQLAAAQRAILGSAAMAVRPGGRLVYATCSGEPEENEAVVGAFLAEARGFAPVDPLDVSAGLPEQARHLVDAGGWFRTLPSRDALEAFVAVVIERRG